MVCVDFFEMDIKHQKRRVISFNSIIIHNLVRKTRKPYGLWENCNLLSTHKKCHWSAMLILVHNAQSTFTESDWIRTAELQLSLFTSARLHIF